MGVDTQLYLSTRWEADDIKAVLERTCEKEVDVISHHNISVGFFTFNVGQRRISVFMNNFTPLGSLTLLSMRADEESHRILKGVARTLGGLFMPYDTDGLCDWIDGGMNDHNGLPYFVKYAIVEDGIDPHDADELLASMKRWREQMKGAK